MRTAVTGMLARVQLPDPGDGEEHTHIEEFDFADLRFIKSSRMSKRRLAFVLQLQVTTPARSSSIEAAERAKYLCASGPVFAVSGPG